jgi:predicted protein tyrosine phosphatase
MEAKHERILKERFPECLGGKPFICLDLPDIYRCMEPALIEELKARLGKYIAVPE